MNLFLKNFFIFLLFLIIGIKGNIKYRKLSHILNTVSVSSQCCRQKGYTECGKINKDCCKSGCITSWFMQFCDGGDENKLTQGCQSTCINECHKQDGYMCSHGYVGEMQCCKKQDCVGQIKGQCKRGTVFNLGNCIPDSQTQKASSTVSELFSDINPFKSDN